MKVHMKAGKAVAVEGEVVLDGQDGVAVFMSPNAAQWTAEELQRTPDDGEAQPRQESHELPPEKRTQPPEAQDNRGSAS